MVDFNKLRSKKPRSRVVEPLEIFRRLPKPPGINDLYTSQAEVLQSWFQHRTNRDTIIKLHTGGGKTLVGLLVAHSTLTELSEPVLYLTPTQQLVQQTLDKAKAHGIPATPYVKGQPLSADFLNAKAVMVGTYKALFNGQSKFGVRGQRPPVQAAAVVLDDAHVAIPVIRDSFTLTIDASVEGSPYESLTALFRKAFKDIDRLGTFDDVIGGREDMTLEVPYWAWHKRIDAVREQLQGASESHAFVWPLLRDRLHLCHALISRTAFTITALLPLVNAFPTFAEAPRRIYMSATISDDSDLVRTFDAEPEAIPRALTSRSLAGISERMILIPSLMSFSFDAKEAVKKLAAWTAQTCRVGVVILVPSDKAATTWTEPATVAKGSPAVARLVSALQSGVTRGPAVFANRYDGIDLPSDSCRLLVMDGLPIGTSDYERFRASTLYGGSTITRMLAQRIEQGIGRGARGAGDHCVVLLIGRDLAAWVAKDANYRFLTDATRAQLEMGAEVSKELGDHKELARTIRRSYGRDEEWITYHAVTLAELAEAKTSNQALVSQAAAERKAVQLWNDGYHDKAIAKIQRLVTEVEGLDPQIRGWMEQLGARIADSWGNPSLAEDLQRQAYSHNANLLRSKVLPPYRPLQAPGSQERALAQRIAAFRLRRGALYDFEQVVAFLHRGSSSNQFEQALADLGAWIGLSTERLDVHGRGPDVLWLLPSKTGLVIEAKSRKGEAKALTKKDHGQLLVAAEWFEANYKGYKCVRVSLQPGSRATKAAAATASYALTYERLAVLVSDARVLLTELCECHLSADELPGQCSRLLADSHLRSDRLVAHYMERFTEEG